MSAFIIHPFTMHRVVAGLMYARHQYAIDHPNEIGQLLFELNIDAVNHRYSECSPYVGYAFVMPYDCEHVDQMHSEEIADATRAIDCLIYQCSEGDIPERQLYKDLTLNRDRLNKDLELLLHPAELSCLRSKLNWNDTHEDPLGLYAPHFHIPIPSKEDGYDDLPW